MIESTKDKRRRLHLELERLAAKYPVGFSGRAEAIMALWHMMLEIRGD